MAPEEAVRHKTRAREEISEVEAAANYLELALNHLLGDIKDWLNEKQKNAESVDEVLELAVALLTDDITETIDNITHKQ